MKSLTAAFGWEVSSTAELLADELLTNAVRHGGGSFSMTVTIDDDCLRVEVADLVPAAQLVPTAPGHLREGGRGLTVVNALATSWGTDRLGDHKSVWFELDLRH